MAKIIEGIIDFLNSIEGWADEAAVESEPMPGLHFITIKKGDFTYTDQYGGGEPFQGLEIVWKNNHLVWMMSYRGEYKGKVDYKIFLSFLKAALRSSPKYMPIRGPKKFSEMKLPGWGYNNKWNGNMSGFKGKEEISFKNSKVYSAEYYGGLVDIKKEG